MMVSSTAYLSSAIKSCAWKFRTSVSLIALLCGLGCAQPSFAQSLPTGGKVVSGSVAINSTSPTGLTITQSSGTGIVNWSSFSIGQGYQVQFNNGTGATLNRVTGNVPSSINGVLSATGSVYLVNPSGVVVGPTGVINTGGSFVASTLDVKDADFRAGGSLTFNGNSSASVVNLGKIGSSKGDVVLIARQVHNDGSLTARNGTAAMASGSEVVLSDGSLGNGKVLVRRPAQDGEIRNSGAVRAAEIELRANGGNIYALAGNTGRAITATGIASKGGRIFLTAEGGSVTVTQKVVARRIQANIAPALAHARTAGPRGPVTGGDIVVSADKVVVGGTIAARGRDGAGGTVVVTGKDVTLTSGAAIDASGTSGGTVLIGGDRAGGSDVALKFLPQTIANAQTTTLEAGATVTADGTSGAGGNVVVWSDGATSFAGAISAKGLRGGFIETSGHVLNITGGSVAAGKGGTWLLDPADLTIDPTLAGVIASTLNGGTDVIEQTTASGTGGSGDITVASGISWATSATLTLSAYRNIIVNADIISTGSGAVVLRADNTGTGIGTLSFGPGQGSPPQIATDGPVSIFYNPTGNDSTTVNATSYTTPTDYGFYITGAGPFTATMLVNNVYDLQNVRNNLGGTYALGRDIDASATVAWNGGAGFVPIGNASATFNASFDGQGHTISGLVVNRPGSNYVGLFGYIGTFATVGNVGLLGGSVIGSSYVGALAGENNGSITGSYATGAVTSSGAATDTGGLVGYNSGSITQSYATGTVTGQNQVGGLAGFSPGTITQSYAAGTVSGTSEVGGLVGHNGYSAGGTITQSYATGAVSGTTFVGGLVGKNDTGGTITGAYATGAVSSTTNVGGFVGNNANADPNSIQASYWDSYTTGQAAGIGGGTASAGLAEVTSDPAQSAAANYAFNQSAYGNFDFTAGNAATGWFMIDGRTRPFGQWEYCTSITNTHQLQLMAMDLGANYKLASAIDFSSGLAAGGKYPGMWSSSGFSPIGNLSTQFTGSLDGQSHVISNLAINLPSDAYIGLFGSIGTGGSVSNLGLQNATITGLGYVGGLTGFNSGSISSVSVSGAITGSLRVGGLVGQNNFNASISNASASGTVVASIGYAGGLVGVNNLGSISGSFATVDVSGNGTGTAPFGGLVGWNNGTTSIIQNSYATGTVNSGTGSTRTGGLVGQNNGKVFDSYATGAVSGGTQGTGGLVGYNASGAKIMRTYATGTVNASALVGGLVGSNAGSVAQSYWDTTTSGRSVGIGAGTATGATGLTTSQMQDPANFASTYAGWDFANVWSAPSAGYYPQLYGVNYVLRVAPANASRVYGDVNPAFTYSIYGLHGGDTSGIVTGLSVSTAATSSSNAGSYAITASGGSATSASGQTYRFINAPGTLTVTPRSIAVTADAQTRSYGDVNPMLTYQVSGLINGDTLSGALATSATAASNVGVYGITQGTLASPNYTVSSFTGANLTVTPRSITVTADARSRAYGDANPALTYQVVGSGLVNGDALSGALATAATAASNVGVYGINQGTLAASTNYALNYASANLSVTPRPITVTADAKSRAYGDANPALTYQVVGSGLVNGDILSGALTTSATAASDVGVHGITQGTLAASSNYAFAFVGANLTITPAAPQVPAATPRVPTEGFGSYVKSPVRAPQPSEQMRESESIEESSPEIICKSRRCLELPHPHNRRIGTHARFVGTMTNRNRLPAFVDN
jgi:filamentous hemagglutinin family protein